jgi:hypothetical protein
MPLAAPAQGARRVRRPGRHLRRAAVHVGVITAVTLPAALLAILLAPDYVLPAALIAAVIVPALGLCRLILAHDNDVGEELWLRRVLGELRGDGDEDGDEDADADPDLLVY